MIIQKTLISILLFTLLASCNATYQLSNLDFSWMPYRGNETLVFTSYNDDIDTIFLLEKDTLIEYPEAQAINGQTYEVLSIICRHSNVSNNSYRYSFIELQKSKDRKARLHFNLEAKDASFYRLTGVRVDSLAQLTPTSLVTKAKSYTDVYIIHDDEYGLHFNMRSNYVTKIYWSKVDGLVRYDKKDGVIWELTNKYSP